MEVGLSGLNCANIRAFEVHVAARLHHQSSQPRRTTGNHQAESRALASAEHSIVAGHSNGGAGRSKGEDGRTA